MTPTTHLFIHFILFLIIIKQFNKKIINIKEIKKRKMLPKNANPATLTLNSQP